jgi:DNA modification methylase
MLEQKNEKSSSNCLEKPFWRVLTSNGRRKRIGKHGVDLGERGVYDKRNPLNELTGREWTYFLNSVWVTAYPPVAADFAFDLRKVHPCPKPPQLMRDIVLFFTKRYQWILDPFAGVGGTLLGASICDPPRRTVGIEINRAYVEIYEEVCENTKIALQTLICDDARNMLSHDEVSGRMFDLILTDPPYSNLMNRPKNGQKKRLYGRNDPTPFSNDPRDIGNLKYNEFLVELRKILEKAVSRLKPKKYLVLFSRDLQPSHKKPNLLHADVVNEILSIPCLSYKGMRIWHDQAVDLYPFGYPYAFVANQMHQYILVFRKEKQSKPEPTG